MTDSENEPLLTAFPPIVRSDARVLVLGSMPGVRSLAEQRYYAHPQNAFWPIMGRLAGAGPGRPYAERVERLKDAGVALWDVLAECRRPGSLDSRIRPGSVRANDFASLLEGLPAIRRIAFNGRAAETLFRRHVAPDLPRPAAAVPRVVLPSTSPAYAAMPREAKLEAWREALGDLVGSA
ncbi:MAG: DNA-deoxyinosine glycosylase [Wenzhouxiangellaceae bacterium]|nr:DNA-deoxyinosine glycosylase [Wenzhouxiangellaceae bacterium]